MARLGLTLNEHEWEEIPNICERWWSPIDRNHDKNWNTMWMFLEVLARLELV